MPYKDPEARKNNEREKRFKQKKYEDLCKLVLSKKGEDVIDLQDVVKGMDIPSLEEAQLYLGKQKAKAEYKKNWRKDNSEKCKSYNKKSKAKRRETLKKYHEPLPKLFIICGHCQKEVVVPKSQLKRKYCDRTCFFLAYQVRTCKYKGLKRPPIKYGVPSTAFKKGNIPWNFIDGRSKDIDLLSRRGVAVTKWRKSVYMRDNYTCQKCWEKGGRLHAHHILNFKTNEELRTELYNGITLCEKDHKAFHKTYGLKNNTREQLIEFLDVNKREDAYT